MHDFDCDSTKVIQLVRLNKKVAKFATNQWLVLKSKQSSINDAGPVI